MLSTILFLGHAPVFASHTFNCNCIITNKSDRCYNLKNNYFSFYGKLQKLDGGHCYLGDPECYYKIQLSVSEQYDKNCIKPKSTVTYKESWPCWVNSGEILAYQALVPRIAIFSAEQVNDNPSPIMVAGNYNFLPFYEWKFDVNYGGGTAHLGFVFHGYQHESTWETFKQTGTFNGVGSLNKPAQMRYQQPRNIGIPVDCNGTMYITIDTDGSMHINDPSKVPSIQKSCSVHGDPIDSVTGKVKESVLDFRNNSPFPFNIKRYYHSTKGWMLTYKMQYMVFHEGYVKFYRPDGLILEKPHCSKEHLNDCVNRGTGEYSYTFANGITEFYDTKGQLVQLKNTQGLSQYLTYAADKITITDEFGSNINLLLNNDQVTTIKLPNGATIDYRYDDLGNLIGVVYPNGQALRYTYDANKSASQELASLAVSNNIDDWTEIARWTYGADGKALDNSMHHKAA